MSGSLSTKFRLVRCPQCRVILPEPTNFPKYKCGGCNTVLRGKNFKNDTKDTDVRIPVTIVGKKRKLEQDSEDKEAQNLSKEDIEARSLSKEDEEAQSLSKEDEEARSLSKEDEEARSLSKEDEEAQSLSKEDEEARSLSKEDEEAQSLSKEERLLCSLLLFGSFLRFGPRIEDFLWSVNYILSYRKKKEERLSSSGELPLDKNNGSAEKGNEDSNMNQSRITHHGNKESLPVAEADQDKCSLKQNNGGNPKEDVQRNGKHVEGLNFLDEVDSPTESNHHKSAESEVDNSRNCMEEENGGGNFSDEVASPTEPNHHKSAERLSSAGELLLDKNNGSDEMENKDSNMNRSGITRHGNEESLPVEEDKCSLNQSNGGNPKDYVQLNGKRVGGLNFSDDVASPTEPNNHKSAETEADKNGNCMEDENGGVNIFDGVASSTELNHLGSEKSSLVAKACSKVHDMLHIAYPVFILIPSILLFQTPPKMNPKEDVQRNGKHVGAVNFLDEVDSPTEPNNHKSAESEADKNGNCVEEENGGVNIFDKVASSTELNHIDSEKSLLVAEARSEVHDMLPIVYPVFILIPSILLFHTTPKMNPKEDIQRKGKHVRGVNFLDEVDSPTEPNHQKSAESEVDNSRSCMEKENGGENFSDEVASPTEPDHRKSAERLSSAGELLLNKNNGSDEMENKDSNMNWSGITLHVNEESLPVEEDKCSLNQSNGGNPKDYVQQNEKRVGGLNISGEVASLTEPNNHKSAESEADKNWNRVEEENGGVNVFDEVVSSTEPNHLDSKESSLVAEARSEVDEIGCCLEQENGRNQNEYGICSGKQTGGINFSDEVVSSTELQISVAEQRVTKLPLCLGGLTAESASSSHWPIGLPDGRHIVVLDPLEQSIKYVAHVDRVDQCSATVSLPEKKMVRKTLKRKCTTMRVIFEIHQEDFGRRCEGSARSFRGSSTRLLLSHLYTGAHAATRICKKHGSNRISIVKRINKQHGIHRWPFRQKWATKKGYSTGDGRSFEANSLSMNEKLDSRLQFIHMSQCAKADESGSTASNSEKGSMREALKRDSLTNSLSLKDLRQHFNARRKDAVKDLCDSLAWKSLEVLDSLPLGEQSNSIRHLARRRTLTHKHCVRLKKSQDLPRSLLRDCSRELVAQSATGLPDGGHIRSLSEKKIVRKTLKRKGRTTRLLSLEDHQQHVGRRWEDGAQFLGAERICRQLAINRESTTKRIHRQHWSCQWPFKQKWATRKGYSGGDKRSFEVSSLSMSPCAEADESGPAVSNLEKGSMREALKRDSLKDLRRHFGARCKDAAKGLCDALAWKSFEVLDNLLLGEQSKSIRNLDRQRELTQKHCVRLKKSQDLPRSLLSDCSGELAAQFATGFLDGEHIPSLLEKKIARNTLKRKSRTMSVPSFEDHQQHVGRRWEDDANILGAKRICRQLAIDLEPAAKRIRRQHGTRRWPFKQSAIGLPDEGYMLSLSKKKIMRKTLKRKCRNMSVLSLEYHQHVDSKWEDSVNSIGGKVLQLAKHIYRQLVIHRVSRAKRIHRQHGIHRWPFQQNLATCKGYFLGGERPDDVISLSIDGKLVSRLQLIHISWLGRFSPWPPALPPGGEIVEPPLALSSSQLPSTSNRAHLGGQDRSGSTTSHSQNERTRDQPEGRKRKIKNLTIEDLRPYVGLTRADAAKKFQMSETTFKRQCRRLKIDQWPKLPSGEEILKPPDPPGRNAGQIGMVNEFGHLPERIEVSRPPDSRERNTGQTEEENDVVVHVHVQNHLQDYFDSPIGWFEGNDSTDLQNVLQGIEVDQVIDEPLLSSAYPNPNPDVFLQPQVALTQMVSGHMGIPNNRRNSLASPAETHFEGHGAVSSNHCLNPNPDVFLQPQVALTHMVSGNMGIPNNQRNSLASPAETRLVGHGAVSSNHCSNPNPDVFLQPQVALTHMVSGNMGIPNNLRNSLASPPETRLEGHGSVSSNHCPNPNPIVFLQPQVALTHMASGHMGIPNNQRNSLSSPAETRLEGHGTVSSNQAMIQPMSTLPQMTPPSTSSEDTSSVMLKVYGLRKIIIFPFPLTSGINELKGEVAMRLDLQKDSFDMNYKDDEGENIFIPLDKDLRYYLTKRTSSVNSVIKLWVVNNDANPTNLCGSCGGSLMR